MTKNLESLFKTALAAMLIFTIMPFSISSACTPNTPYARSANLPQITELKNLYLDTSIIESCTAGGISFGTVIIAPEGRYADDVTALKTAIKDKCPCPGFESVMMTDFLNVDSPGRHTDHDRSEGID